MDFQMQGSRRIARTVEKVPVALHRLAKLAEAFRIPGKFPTKEGKIHLDPEFLKKCFMTRLVWEQLGVTTQSDATDFRDFNGVVLLVYDGT